MISKTEDDRKKGELQRQLDEVNAGLLGLYTARLRRTLKDAGLPPEERLVAEGKIQLQPQQATNLKKQITEIETLPLSESIMNLSVLAYAQYYTGQYEEAKRTIDIALTTKPNDPGLLNNRALMYHSLKQFDKALADFNQSLKITPNDPVTLMNRGRTYGTIDRNNESLADLNASLKIRPNQTKTIINRGVTYTQMKRYDEAFSDFNDALKLDPNRAEALYNIACLFSLQNKVDDAIFYLEKAVSKNKESKDKAKTDKDFDNIRNDPRFKKLIEE